MSNLNTMIKNVLGEKTILKIKTLLSEQVAATPVVAVVDTPIALAEVTLKDGSKISYEGEKLDVGVAVKLVNADGSSAEIIDGEYELEDGSKIYVKGGLVEKIEAAIVAPVVEVPELDMASRVAALESTLKAMTDKDKATETMLSRLEEIEKISNSNSVAVKTTLEAINAIVEMPAADPIVSNKKDYKDMSKHEKLLFNKGKL
ncbi:MAG: hypothetical protein IPG89_21640 [Bacteroidetes bacterium]|nr:hypothetical protein [Bacteroidota bacterium]